MLHSGANKAVNDAFLTLYDTYLANDRPPTTQASAKAVMKQYENGNLTAKQLADLVSAFYKAISDHQDVSQEQAAWLSNVECTEDHWKKLGYLEYGDHLTAIDPHGNARKMVNIHRENVRRKAIAINNVQECWAHSPELRELVPANEGDGKWRSFASLAKATDGAPEVAKYCLNKALLARLQCGKTGRGATHFFTGPGLIKVRKMAATIDWAARPWDKERYERISDYRLKIYRGIVLPKTKYPTPITAV